MSHVLIVDDEESICWALRRLLEEEGHQVAVASSAEEALRVAEEQTPDLVMLDVRLPGMDGISAMAPLQRVAAEHVGGREGNVPIVVMTAFGSLSTAVAALGNGAFDYLIKPFDLEQAAGVIDRALSQPQRCAMRTVEPAEADELIGVSQAMQEVFKQIALAAPSGASVLITGESGTGKELVARAIHRHSRHAAGPWVPVNLASLSPTLVESELFGHVRGAFTGAAHSRQGLLELAHGGTLFFDEVGDIPPPVQVKLLRTLEQQEVVPVGSAVGRRSDFRVVAATHRDLSSEIHQGGFRQDLYYRLAVFEIRLPALRDRPEDIPLLAERFLRRIAAPAGESRFTEGAISEMLRRPWPGNVRELRNAVEHAALLARGGPIFSGHLPPAAELASAAGDAAGALRAAVVAWTQSQLARRDQQDALYEKFLAEADPALIETVLRTTGRNRLAAAKVLGMHRATLRKKLADPESGGKSG